MIRNSIVFLFSFLNNQPDALIIQIYSVINSTCFGHLLCPSPGILYCTSWLCLEAVIKNLHETYQCRMYSRKLL